MSTAFLSIGSNIERRRNVTAALVLLEECFGPLRVSTIYECPAVGFKGSDFHNLAVAFESEIPPQQLDDRLKDIEYQLGRRRSAVKYSDRPIDIDLVMYGGLAGRFGRLTLPRRDVLRRPFILGPLADIAPAFVHPLVHRSLAELWRELAAIDNGGLCPVAPRPTAE